MTDTFPTTGPTDVRPTYAERVAMLEAEGLTTSDAQGVADAEILTGELAEPEAEHYIVPVGGHSNRDWCRTHKAYANEPWSSDAPCNGPVHR